jgi:hypothetical protein
LRFRVGGFQDIKAVDRVLDVFGQYKARYMFCYERLESIHGGVKASTLDSSEACV